MESPTSCFGQRTAACLIRLNSQKAFLAQLAISVGVAQGLHCAGKRPREDVQLRTLLCPANGNEQMREPNSPDRSGQSPS